MDKLSDSLNIPATQALMDQHVPSLNAILDVIFDGEETFATGSFDTRLSECGEYSATALTIVVVFGDDVARKHQPLAEAYASNVAVWFHELILRCPAKIHAVVLFTTRKTAEKRVLEVTRE